MTEIIFFVFIVLAVSLIATYLDPIVRTGMLGDFGRSQELSKHKKFKDMIAAGINMDISEARKCLKEVAQLSRSIDISGFKEFIVDAMEEDFCDKDKAHILIKEAIEKVQIFRANHIDIDCDSILGGLIRLAQLTK